MKKKFFVILSVVVAGLLSGCTFPLPNDQGHPPPNYAVHFVNETQYRVRIFEDGYIKQHYVLPGQSQVFPWTVDNDRDIQIAYRIVAYRIDENTGKETTVSSKNFTLEVRGEEDVSLISRIFLVRYEWGANLIVEEQGGLSRGLFGF